MNLLNKQKCSCCGKEFNIRSKKEHKWQLDNEIFCSYTCYSKVFDGKYKASKFNLNASESGYTKGKVISKGYERHGSR